MSHCPDDQLGKAIFVWSTTRKYSHSYPQRQREMELWKREGGVDGRGCGETWKKRSKDFRDHYGRSTKFRVKVGLFLFSGMGRWKREGGPTWG